MSASDWSALAAFSPPSPAHGAKIPPIGFESRVAPGMPIQILCYNAPTISPPESAASSPALMAFAPAFPRSILANSHGREVKQERVLYLLDPTHASRRSLTLHAGMPLFAHSAVSSASRPRIELPWTPRFLHSEADWSSPSGQFNQWVGLQLMAGGLVQNLARNPGSRTLFADNQTRTINIVGVRLTDQGVDKSGAPPMASCPAWMSAPS